MSQEPEPPLPESQPTRELLLAQALDTCVSAERRVPGSADLIIAHQPVWARTELRRLVSLAGSLEAVATNAVMSEEFRVAARGRLLQRIGGGAGAFAIIGGASLASLPSRNGYHPPLRRRRSRWLWRGSVGTLFAAVLGVAATLTASANSLPGEPLYGIKQASEELGVRFASDDQARALALLSQADARLNETARLLQAGRTDQVTQTTQRFDEVINRATTTFVVTIADAPAEAPATTNMETKLTQQQQQLQAMLSTAPEPARADLREALVATERSRALVSAAQAVDRSAGHGSGSRSSVAAPVPTVAAEDLTQPTAVPTPIPLVAEGPPPPRGASAGTADSHDSSSPIEAIRRNAHERDDRQVTAQDALVSRGSTGGGGPGPSSRTSGGRSNGSVSVSRGGDDEDHERGEQPSVPSLVARSVDVPSVTSEDGDRDLSVSGRGSAAAVANDGRGGSGSGQLDERGRAGDDVAQPGVVTHNGVPSSGSSGSGDGGPKPAPPIVVAQSGGQSDKSAAFVDRLGKDGGGDGRQSSTPATATQRVQATPTPTSQVANRGGGDSSSSRGSSNSGSGSASVSGSGSGTSTSSGSSGGDHSGGGDHGGGGSDH